MSAFQKIRQFFKGTSSEVSGGAEKRSFYRYQIPADLPLHLECLEPVGLSLHLSEIGLEGASFSCAGKNPELVIGQTIAFQLSFEGREVTLVGQVIRCEGKSLAVRFAQGDEGRHTFFSHLIPRLLGVALKEMPLKLEQNLAPCRWFRGQCYTDLFVWQAQSLSPFTLDHVLFLFENNVIEVQRGRGTRTGLVVREKFSAVSHFSFHAEVPPIVYHHRPSTEILGAGTDIIAASALPDEVRAALLEALRLSGAPSEEGRRDLGAILHQRRRWPRYLVLPEEELRIIFAVPELSVRFEELPKKTHPKTALNISRGGVAVCLEKREDPSHYPIGQEVLLTLDWGGRQLTQKGRIASYLSKERSLGVEFIGLEPATDSFLKEILDPKRLGASLREVLLKQSDKERKLRWFHGESASDLFYWQTSEGSIHRAEFILGVDLIEWNETGDMRTGEVYRDDFAMIRFSYPVTEPNLIRYHETKSRTVIQRAQAALSAAVIDPAIKGVLLQQLWNA